MRDVPPSRTVAVDCAAASDCHVGEAVAVQQRPGPPTRRFPHRYRRDGAASSVGCVADGSMRTVLRPGSQRGPVRKVPLAARSSASGRSGGEGRSVVILTPSPTAADCAEILRTEHPPHGARRGGRPRGGRKEQRNVGHHSSDGLRSEPARTSSSSCCCYSRRPAVTRYNTRV